MNLFHSQTPVKVCPLFWLAVITNHRQYKLLCRQIRLQVHRENYIINLDNFFSFSLQIDSFLFLISALCLCIAKVENVVLNYVTLEVLQQYFLFRLYLILTLACKLRIGNYSLNIHYELLQYIVFKQKNLENLSWFEFPMRSPGGLEKTRQTDRLLNKM